MLYDRIAPNYTRMHSRWLRYAGGEAQAAFEASLVTRAHPGARVLDAGCGTGELAKSLLHRFHGHIDLTLFDESQGMLDQVGDAKAKRVRGSLLDMPFADESFDITIAAWSIEASADPKAAIAELMRVTRPGGHIMTVFCAAERTDRIAARVLRFSVETRGTGRFLDTSEIAAAFTANGADAVTRHRCTGPAAVLDVHKASSQTIAWAA